MNKQMLMDLIGELMDANMRSEVSDPHKVSVDSLVARLERDGHQVGVSIKGEIRDSSPSIPFVTRFMILTVDGEDYEMVSSLWDGSPDGTYIFDHEDEMFGEVVHSHQYVDHTMLSLMDKGYDVVEYSRQHDLGEDGMKIVLRAGDVCNTFYISEGLVWHASDVDSEE